MGDQLCKQVMYGAPGVWDRDARIVPPHSSHYPCVEIIQDLQGHSQAFIPCLFPMRPVSPMHMSHVGNHEGGTEAGVR